MSNSFKCKPRQARQFIIECLEAGLVPYLQSSPGMGKSSIVKSISNDFRLWLIDHRLSTSEPVDLTGMPKFKQIGKYERVGYTPFDIFPLEGDPIPLDAKGEEMAGWLLFLDEAPAAQRQVQAASYKLILDRMIGQHKLHPNVAMVLAGNLMSDRSIVNPLSTAMQSRLIHLEMEIDFAQWLEDVALKENYDSRVIAFLMQWPEKLMDFRPDHQEKTFCCPRTWEFVNRLVTGYDDQGNKQQKPISDSMAPLLTGAITSGVALEFLKFIQIYSQLISIHDILKDPNACRIPHDLNLKWATVTHMMEKIDDKNFDALATYADRFDLSFRLLFYRSVLLRKRSLKAHPKFGSHIAKISQYLHETPNYHNPQP